jgi:ABC-type uncharacterized transport system permease subunit
VGTGRRDVSTWLGFWTRHRSANTFVVDIVTAIPISIAISVPPTSATTTDWREMNETDGPTEINEWRWIHNGPRVWQKFVHIFFFLLFLLTSKSKTANILCFL